MSTNLDFEKLTEPLAELIENYLAGEFDYPEFQRRFQPVLEDYEKKVGGKAYWPLDVIADVPRHCRKDLNQYCRQAIERLPKEALERSTRIWVESELIEHDQTYSFFNFFDPSGSSRFGAHAAFYSNPVEQYSFLLSSLNATFVPPPFRFAELLQRLRDVGGNELATWVYGTEPDNVIAMIDRISGLGDPYGEPDRLRWIEQQPAPEGGGSYLMLLPKSKKWMLLNEYDYNRFTIYLHGEVEFIDRVAQGIGAQTIWNFDSRNGT